MLTLYDLCCTGSWASLITAQFRSKKTDQESLWCLQPLSPYFIQHQHHLAYFMSSWYCTKAHAGLSSPPFPVITSLSILTIMFTLFSTMHHKWSPAYLDSLHLLFTLPTCPAFCSKQKGKLITNRGYFRSKFGTLAVHSKNSYLGGLDQSQN